MSQELLSLFFFLYSYFQNRGITSLSMNELVLDRAENLASIFMYD